jgi:hypothetical protein
VPPTLPLQPLFLPPFRGGDTSKNSERGRRRVASIKRAINQLPLFLVPTQTALLLHLSWRRPQGRPAPEGVYLISRVRLRQHRWEVWGRGRGGRKQKSCRLPSFQVAFLARFSLEMCIFRCVSRFSSGMWGAVLPVCIECQHGIVCRVLCRLVSSLINSAWNSLSCAVWFVL